MRLLFATVILLSLTHHSRADKLVLVAGGGELGDGHDATKAKLIQPFGVDFHTDGGILIVEMAKGERLRVVTDSGKLHTLAGTLGVKGNDGDGVSALQGKTTFNGMHSLAVGPGGDVYLADTWNNRVRVYVPKSGVVRTFAGTGEKGFAGDGGPVEKARFGGVYCVAFDPEKKNLFITDLDNRRIRKVDMTIEDRHDRGRQWPEGRSEGR